MIRRSIHFTSRVYNRKALFPSAKAIVIEAGVQEDGGFFTEEDASDYQEKVDNSPRLREARQQERESGLVLGERNTREDDFYQRLGEEREYEQYRIPDRYGWDQFAGGSRY